MNNDKEKKILRLAGWLFDVKEKYTKEKLGKLGLEDIPVLTICLCEDIEHPMPDLTLHDCYRIAEQLKSLELDQDKLARAILIGIKSSSHYSDEYQPCSMCKKMKKLGTEISLGQRYCKKCKQIYNAEVQAYDAVTKGRRRLTK